MRNSEYVHVNMPFYMYANLAFTLSSNGVKVTCTWLLQTRNVLCTRFHIHNLYTYILHILFNISETQSKRSGENLQNSG